MYLVSSIFVLAVLTLPNMRLEYRVDPLWVVDERITVALNLEDNVVAIVLFIRGWVEVVPCF